MKTRFDTLRPLFPKTGPTITELTRTINRLDPRTPQADEFSGFDPWPVSSPQKDARSLKVVSSRGVPDLASHSGLLQSLSKCNPLLRSQNSTGFAHAVGMQCAFGFGTAFDLWQQVA